MRVYKKDSDKYVLLWPEDTGATSETYLNFLRQFLPEFHRFLLAEGLLEGWYFHLSDEPGSDKHVENYRKARKVLHDLAPWMKVMDALSDVRYGKEGLTDIPVSLVSAGGFLHWGFDYWQRIAREEPLDPLTNGDGGAWPGIPYGDPFVIYPGVDGPIDSIHREVFAESLQDYAILQTTGIGRDDPPLTPLRSYAVCPREEAWLRKSPEAVGC